MDAVKEGEVLEVKESYTPQFSDILDKDFEEPSQKFNFQKRYVIYNRVNNSIMYWFSSIWLGISIESCKFFVEKM